MFVMKELKDSQKPINIFRFIFHSGWDECVQRCFKLESFSKVLARVLSDKIRWKNIDNYRIRFLFVLNWRKAFKHSKCKQNSLSKSFHNICCHNQCTTLLPVFYTAGLRDFQLFPNILISVAHSALSLSRDRTQNLTSGLKTFVIGLGN